MDHVHIVAAMNHHASIFHDSTNWTKQHKFHYLISWTQSASSNKLAKFAAD